MKGVTENAGVEIAASLIIMREQTAGMENVGVGGLA